MWLTLLIGHVLKTTVSSLRMVPVHSWTFNWCAEMPRVVRRYYYLSRSDCPECKLWPPLSTEAHSARPCIRMTVWQQPQPCSSGGTFRQALYVNLRPPGIRGGIGTLSVLNPESVIFAAPHVCLCPVHIAFTNCICFRRRWEIDDRVDPCLSTLTQYSAYRFVCKASSKCTSDTPNPRESF